jgi:hypothetical protein
MRTLVSAATAVAAVALGLVCAVAVKWYVVDVLIGLRDEADRSLQFWGIAVLGVGILAGVGAVGLAVLARKVHAGRPAA